MASLWSVVTSLFSVFCHIIQYSFENPIEFAIIICLALLVWWWVCKSKKQIASKKSLWSYWFPDKTKSPICAKKNESICREKVERFFNDKFPTMRPSWLINPETGRRLELDMYNERLGVAVEYNGVQHYQFTPYWHKTEDDFHSQVRRDNCKADICKQRGIKLISVPYTITSDKMDNFLLSEFSKHGIV